MAKQIDIEYMIRLSTWVPLNGTPALVLHKRDDGLVMLATLASGHDSLMVY